MTLGPSEVLTKDNVKVRWGERYTSDAINKKFLGIPRGVYLGFAPQASGLILSLIPDRAITLVSPSSTPFAINDVITGGTTATNAIVLAISTGFLLIGAPSGGTGSFQAGEVITAAPSGASATVGAYTTEAISFARTVSSTPLVPGRSEDVVDLVTGDTITLDFTGFANGTYYIFATGAYAVGSATTGTISSRTAPPPNGTSEVLICVVTKLGLNLTIQATAPATRQEPFATAGSRIGFMPGGAIDSLSAATLTTSEVIASRVDTAGTTASTFNPSTAQTTGVPARIASDLARAGMANRLGKRAVVVQANDYDPTTTPAIVIANVAQTGTANTVYNISGSFAGRTRDHQPFKDDTNGTLPGQTLTFTAVTGTFSVGETVTGKNGTTGIIQALTLLTITVYNIIGHGFNNGEVVTGNTSGAFATISSTTGGIRIPVVIDPNGSDVLTLAVTATSSAGTVVTGNLSGAQGVVRAATGSTIDLDQLFGVFRVGETLSPGGATITGIDQRLGAITAAADGSSGDTERNNATIVELVTGRKPVDNNGNPFFGRLLFGPNGAAGAPGSGGGPGELLVAGSPGQAIAFSVGGITDVFANIDFTKYFLPGDLIEGADGRFYEISPVVGSVTSTSITLTAGKPYLGSPAQAGAAATGAGAVPVARRRRRYVLEPVVRATNADTPTPIVIGTNTPAAAKLRFFFPTWMTEEQSNFDAHFTTSAPGDGIIIATTAGTDTNAGHVVSSADTRLAKIKAELGGSGTTGLEPIVNFIQGSGIGITVTESGGKIHVTVTNTNPGGGGPSPGGNIQALTPGGGNSSGSDSAYARDDHVHGLPAYPAAPFVTAAVDNNVSHNAAFSMTCHNPRLALCAHTSGGPVVGIGFAAWDGSGTTQGGISTGSFTVGSTTQIIATTNGNWTASFNATTFTMSPSGGNSFQMSTAVIGGGG